jgi:hypothetical protein
MDILMQSGTGRGDAAGSVCARITQLLDGELAGFDAEALAAGPMGSGSVDWHRATRAEFEAALVAPEALAVDFVGGRQECWAVTRSDGRYRVVYVPSADYFALVVDLKFGAVDINIHGPALGCFGSV